MPDFEAMRERMQARIDDHGYLTWLGVQIESLEPGRAVVRIPYKEELLNPEFGGRRSIHGGVASSIVDSCAGMTVRSALDEPDGTGTATIDLNISYLRPATGDLVATGELVRIGGSIGVAQVSVESETNGGVDEVAVGRASFRIFR